MTSRLRLALVVGALGLSGCADRYNAGPIAYVESRQLAEELGEKPRLQAAVRSTLATVFGPSPQEIRVPEGSGLTNGGLLLANYLRDGDGEGAPIRPIARDVVDPKTGASGRKLQEGGYALYRRQCLHCHGVTGAGDGPTAEFLHPRPRDYRKGLYKFTSTPSLAKPTRDDLFRTIKHGLHGTSMPAFEALMSDDQIRQVVDYVIFLSARGETELALVQEALDAEDEAADEVINQELAEEIVQSVFNKWTAADGQVVDPPVARTPPTRESILRGRELFLGRNTSGNKVECAGCHGTSGKGDGPSFIDERVTQDVVFRLKPLDRAIADLYRANKRAASLAHGGGHGTDHHGTAEPARDEAGVAPFLQANGDLVTYLRERRGLLPDLDARQARERLEGEPQAVASAALKLMPELADPEFRPFFRSQFDLWEKGSLDDWGNPLRPANLNKGIYKGGRRPLDLYWRLAKGINGAKMPSHTPTLPPEQIWDLVNFVLALPYEPELLRDAGPAPAETRVAGVR